MADLIKPRVSVVTKEGECQIHITLDLNVNINGITTKVEDIKVGEVEESPEWVIPTFDSGEKISFGKKG
jgi:hypothetical protein